MGLGAIIGQSHARLLFTKQINAMLYNAAEIITAGIVVQYSLQFFGGKGAEPAAYTATIT
ncbi:MAG TPA: hypothetical protein PKM06_09685 [Bacillota bacterium]|nr:hypothetical protein [Bacillota bacterium]